ncbi:MAG: glycosyl hydrolase, partial [Gemmatimonadetes bacterium]|nr:glycosyl hydrolase [Gemmatimonadota bacterium]
GEANNRQSSSWGDGVYKSSDGGRTWTHVGLRESHHVGRIVVNPLDTDIVYVAALGHLWGPNPERGVYRTTDGGETWEQVLAVDEDTGAVDLAMDPANPKVLYAAMYQRRRSAFGFNGGGPGSGLFKTVDGGRTWAQAGPLVA